MLAFVGPAFFFFMKRKSSIIIKLMGKRFMHFTSIISGQAFFN